MIAIFGAIGMAMGLALILGGTILAEVRLLEVGGVAAAIGGLLFLLKPSARPETSAHAGDMSQEAEALDAYLDEVSPRLPQPALASLARIKETLARVLPALADETKNVDVPAEEHFFAREMISRYLPDACRHYLDVVSATGETAMLDDERTAAESLGRQLDVLHTRLEKTLSKAQEARKAALSPSKEAKPSSESRKAEKP